MLVGCAAQNACAQVDTTYVRSYSDNLVPRILTNFREQVTNFSVLSDTSLSSDYFSTGGQNFLGFEISHKWASIGYSFGFNKENSSRNRDITFSTSLKPVRVQFAYSDLQNMDYYRVDGLNQEDTVFISRQHNIRMQNVRVKFDYVFNYKRFYYSSAVAQYGQQLKSRGSWLLSTSASVQDINLRGLTDSLGQIFLDRYHTNMFRTVKFDLGVGYGYNWVLWKKRLVIYFSDIPNAGYQEIRASVDSIHIKPQPAISITNYAKVGFVYTKNQFFGGIFVYNAVSAAQWFDFEYSSNYTTTQLHFGMVLGNPKNYWKKYKARKGQKENQ